MGPHRIPDRDRQDQRRGAFRLSEIYARSHRGRTSATPHRRVASLELPAVKLKPQCLPDTAYTQTGSFNSRPRLSKTAASIRSLASPACCHGSRSRCGSSSGPRPIRLSFSRSRCPRHNSRSARARSRGVSIWQDLCGLIDPVLPRSVPHELQGRIAAQYSKASSRNSCLLAGISPRRAAALAVRPRVLRSLPASAAPCRAGH